MNLVLFGPPGAGKGTQSEKIIEKYGLKHLSTGDLFRHNIGNKTDLGKLAQKYMDEGNLVPDSVVIDMVIDAVLVQNKDAKGFIFDGFPRTVAQAEELDSIMAKRNGQKIDLMIALSVNEDELTKRLLERGKTSGRTDDQDLDKIKNRIEVYNTNTTPVADFYQSQGKLENVDGIGSIDDIFEKITSYLDKHIK